MQIKNCYSKLTLVIVNTYTEFLVRPYHDTKWQQSLLYKKLINTRFIGVQCTLMYNVQP